MREARSEDQMVKVKICGITNINDAYSAAECGVDALGFIFYPKSQRYVAPAKAKEIIQKLPYKIITVGVFVNHEIQEVNEIVQFCRLNLIQLHGDESPEYCAQFPMSSLIKAVSCQTEKEIQELKNYPIAAILMDAREAGHYGGTGKNSDWRLAIKVKEKHPLILAGGLNMENIREAIERVRPHAVDINSGVEISPGNKDPKKIREIMKIVRETDAPPPQPSPSRGEVGTTRNRGEGGGDKTIFHIFHGNKR
jgi:phosphoribosylanthranilate isomerase